MGQTLLVIGLVIAAIGAAISLGLPLGRLPGDIVIRRENFTLYFPIATGILISLVLTLISMLFRSRGGSRTAPTRLTHTWRSRATAGSGRWPSSTG